MNKIPTGARTYTGSCHCGDVKFEADIDLSAGTGRCNCSFCAKITWWGVLVKPSAFRLLTDPENIADYSRSPYAHSRFCKRCGVRPFGHGDIPEIGGEYVSVNVNCLDGVDLAGVQVTYRDGRHDTWEVLAVSAYVDPFASTSSRSTGEKPAASQEAST